MTAAQRELAPHSITVGDAPDVFQIPPSARPLLVQLERALLEYIQSRLGSLLAQAQRDDRALSEALSEPLKRAGMKSGFGEQAFGGLLGIDVFTHPGALLGVVVTLSMSCDSDSTLFLFSASADRLRHVLTAAAGRRRSLSDGQLGLDYALLPSPQGGDPDVVVVSATPWCSSAWRTLRYAVLSPTKDPARPKRRLVQEDSVWIGNGLSKLAAGPGWFSLSYDTWDTTGDAFVAPKRVHFLEVNGAWKRVAP